MLSSPLRALYNKYRTFTYRAFNGGCEDADADTFMVAIQCPQVLDLHTLH
jgi:hypothetical protein